MWLSNSSAQYLTYNLTYNNNAPSESYAVNTTANTTLDMTTITPSVDTVAVIAPDADTPANPVTFAKALADETRQAIMKHLCCVWLNVNEVVEKLDGRINQPTVSHHLKILQEAELVFVRQEGRQRFYTLNQEYFTVCCNALMTNFAPNHVANVALNL